MPDRAGRGSLGAWDRLFNWGGHLSNFDLVLNFYPIFSFVNFL